MEILIDTGVLLRLTIPADPAHFEARNAVRILKARGDRLCSLLQNAAEFWNVCTRPASARGGYGLSVQETDRRLRLVERLVTFLPDTSATIQEWRRLVVVHSVRGVQVHDARIAAAMNAHGITHLLTFNSGDFKRFQGIIALSPQDVITAARPQQPADS